MIGFYVNSHRKPMWRKSIVWGKLALLIGKEGYRWAEEIDGKYGIAITFWKRQPWHYGVRISILFGHKRPFVRATTYSCPSIGSEGLVRPLDCVVQRPSK